MKSVVTDVTSIIVLKMKKGAVFKCTKLDALHFFNVVNKQFYNGVTWHFRPFCIEIANGKIWIYPNRIVGLDAGIN